MNKKSGCPPLTPTALKQYKTNKNYQNTNNNQGICTTKKQNQNDNLVKPCNKSNVNSSQYLSCSTLKSKNRLNQQAGQHQKTRTLESAQTPNNSKSAVVNKTSISIDINLQSLKSSKPVSENLESAYLDDDGNESQCNSGRSLSERRQLAKLERCMKKSTQNIMKQLESYQNMLEQQSQSVHQPSIVSRNSASNLNDQQTSFDYDQNEYKSRK